MTFQEKFISDYSDIVIKATIGTNLLPSVKMAQACLETGYGQYTIASAKNLYGIKARGKHTPFWTGDFVNAETTELITGRGYVKVRADFRKYKSYTDSVRDHSYFLQQYDRYKPVLAAKTAEEQARELQKAGYATAHDYADKLIFIINKYNLKALDEKKNIIAISD